MLKKSNNFNAFYQCIKKYKQRMKMKLFREDVQKFKMMGTRYGFDIKEITIKADDWQDIIEALDELLKLRAENKKLKKELKNGDYQRLNK